MIKNFCAVVGALSFLFVIILGLSFIGYAVWEWCVEFKRKRLERLDKQLNAEYYGLILLAGFLCGCGQSVRECRIRMGQKQVSHWVQMCNMPDEYKACGRCRPARTEHEVDESRLRAKIYEDQ